MALGDASFDVLRLSAAGDVLWSTTFGSPGPTVATSIATDGGGYALLAGRYASPFDPGSGMMTSPGAADPSDGDDGFLAKIWTKPNRVRTPIVGHVAPEVVHPLLTGCAPSTASIDISRRDRA